VPSLEFMQQNRIELPKEGTLTSCDVLLDFFDNKVECDSIIVDFINAEFYDISSIVALLAKLHILVRNGFSVLIENYKNSGPFLYMQRMNFFEKCGIKLEENFTRHPSRGRFVEIHVIGKGHRIDTARLSDEVADCIAPEEKDLDDPDQTGFYDGVAYSVSELINNVIQHSSSYGFLGAQYYRRDDLTQIIVADVGIGIKQSFIDSDSPYALKATTDQSAVELALRSQISSKTHGRFALNGAENAGVGLTLLKDIALRSGGSFLVISGDSCLKNDNWSTLNNNYQGTFVACSLNRSQLKKFNELLEHAKVENGLTIEDLSLFTKMFE